MPSPRRFAPVALALGLLPAAGAAAGGSDIAGRCDFATYGTPNSNVTIAVVGHATSSGVATGVRCVVRDQGGTTVLDRTSFMPGRVAVLAESDDAAASSFTICWQGSALYGNGSFYQTPLVC